ncbi:40S ribosomal protein SA [Plecturocebus cupreus]
MLAACAIVAIENPADISAIASRNTDQRAVLKFAAATGAILIAGHFTPGTFTNQIQSAFQELQLLVILLCSVWTLPFHATRELTQWVRCGGYGLEVLPMHGISCEHLWEVMPDLYFYRDPEKMKKEEQAAAENIMIKEEFQSEWTPPIFEFTATQSEVTDWSEGVQVPSVPIQQFSTEIGVLSLSQKTGLQLPLVRPLNG